MLQYAFPAMMLATIGVAQAAAVDPNDVPAHRQAWQVLLSQRSTCGEKLVMAADVTPPQMSGFAAVPGYRPLTPYTIYVEAVTVEARWSGPGASLSEADRRNGLRWKGTFQFVAKAAREISVGKSGRSAGWSPWHSNAILFTLDLENRNGVWRAQGQQAPGIQDLGRLAALRRPACSEVPA